MADPVNAVGNEVRARGRWNVEAEENRALALMGFQPWNNLSRMGRRVLYKPTAAVNGFCP